MNKEIEEVPIRVEIGTITIHTLSGVGSVNIGETRIIRQTDTGSKMEKSDSEAY